MQTQTLCDFSLFDPLNLSSIYAHLDNEPQVAQEVVLKKLKADFGAKQVTLFKSKAENYTYIFSKVLPDETLIFIDRFADPSLFDVLATLNHQVVVFEHAHYGDLKRHLTKQAYKARPKIIFSPSLFLSTSKLADVKELRDMAKESGAYLCIDDTHTMGLTGNHFMGSATLIHGIDLIISSLPEASLLATHHCSTLKATTHEVCDIESIAIAKLYSLLLMIPRMHRERKHLRALTTHLNGLFLSHQWDIEHSDFPFISIKHAKLDLLEKQAIKLYTSEVKGRHKPTASLFLNSQHSFSDVNHLFNCFNDTLKYQ